MLDEKHLDEIKRQIPRLIKEEIIKKDAKYKDLMGFFSDDEK